MMAGTSIRLRGGGRHRQARSPAPSAISVKRGLR
jgi:hypothetical protein